MTAMSGRRHHQGQGRRRQGACWLPGAEAASSPEHKRCGYRTLPAFILGTRNFEPLFPFFFKDVAF